MLLHKFILLFIVCLFEGCCGINITVGPSAINEVNIGSNQDYGTVSLTCSYVYIGAPPATTLITWTFTNITGQEVDVIQFNPGFGGQWTWDDAYINRSIELNHIVETDFGQVDIVLNDTVAADDGNYTCIGEGFGGRREQGMVSVTVYVESPSSAPENPGDTPSDIAVGNTVVFSCRVRRAYPAVLLTWDYQTLSNCARVEELPPSEEGPGFTTISNLSVANNGSCDHGSYIATCKGDISDIFKTEFTVYLLQFQGPSGGLDIWIIIIIVIVCLIIIVLIIVLIIYICCPLKLQPICCCCKKRCSRVYSCDGKAKQKDSPDDQAYDNKTSTP